LRHGPAWKAWTEATVHADDEILALAGQWKVPDEPNSIGLSILLYLWNGVEPGDNSAVLQPVLQWGTSPAGGGDYWALGLWYVSNSQGAYHTPLQRVVPGDIIVGSLTRVNGSTTWRVAGSVNGKETMAFSRDVSSDSGPYVYACNTLESIINVCSEYPRDVFVVQNISWSTQNGASLRWVPMTQQPVYCKENATSSSSTTTTVHWNGE
jgi:hypothetical protein